MPKLLQLYPLRLLLMICGLGTTCPLIFILTLYLEIPFQWLMPVLFFAICAMPFVDFSNRKYSALYSFLFRFVLCFAIGFVLFAYATIPVRIVVTVFVFILMSILAFVMSNKSGAVAAVCIVTVMINFFVGIVMHNSDLFIDLERTLNVLIIISFISSTSFFLVLNVNGARWFSEHCLSIPGSMKRSSLVLLAALCGVIAIISLSPWILRGIETLLIGAVRLINSFFEMLANMMAPQSAPVPVEGGMELPFIEDETTSGSGINELFIRIFTWVFITLCIGAVAFFVVKLFIMITGFLMRIFKARREKETLEYDVFTEVIEKIAPSRKKRASRFNIRRPRYSSLLTERERILFIYREYVRRAQRGGFTRNNAGSTPKEILNEVTQSINKETFPPPEGLDFAYNAARYSNDETEITGAEELKQRLL